MCLKCIPILTAACDHLVEKVVFAWRYLESLFLAEEIMSAKLESWGINDGVWRGAAQSKMCAHIVLVAEEPRKSF